MKEQDGEKGEIVPVTNATGSAIWIAMEISGESTDQIT